MLVIRNIKLKKQSLYCRFVIHVWARYGAVVFVFDQLYVLIRSAIIGMANGKIQLKKCIFVN